MRAPFAAVSHAPSAEAIFVIAGWSACWVKGCQTGDRGCFIRPPAIESGKVETGLESRGEAAIDREDSTRGRRPRRGAPPNATMVLSTSSAASPIKAMP